MISHPSYGKLLGSVASSSVTVSAISTRIDGRCERAVAVLRLLLVPLRTMARDDDGYGENEHADQEEWQRVETTWLWPHSGATSKLQTLTR